MSSEGISAATCFSFPLPNMEAIATSKAMTKIPIMTPVTILAD